MFNEIFETIKSYNNIVIARHIGVDPDAMASSLALRNSIKLTFPEKNVYAIGNGSVKFNYIGNIDKEIEINNLSNILLIVTDTPDKKRVDMDELSHYEKSIKIDHHPFIEKYCDIEYIDDEKSSASQIIYELIESTPLKMNKEICEQLYIGVVADTNRFLFNNSTHDTFSVAADMIKKYDIDISRVYYNLYKRPLLEVRFFGYMVNNMKVTENKLGYIKVDNSTILNYKVDAATSGNMINDFHNIEELMVWLTATEDIKNGFIRVSVRSRGPIINKLLENFGGGGHKLASGVKLKTFEEVDNLIEELDKLCKEYLESSDIN